MPSPAESLPGQVLDHRVEGFGGSSVARRDRGRTADELEFVLELATASLRRRARCSACWCKAGRKVDPLSAGRKVDHPQVPRRLNIHPHPPALPAAGGKRPRLRSGARRAKRSRRASVLAAGSPGPCRAGGRSRPSGRGSRRGGRAGRSSPRRSPHRRRSPPRRENGLLEVTIRRGALVAGGDEAEHQVRGFGVKRYVADLVDDE